jgi:hypothetical protein
MERIVHYYSLEEAEEVRQTYSSWIGKKAYTLSGIQEILKNISIKPGRIISGEKTRHGFFVDFEFDNGGQCGSYEFMSRNGLIPTLNMNKLRKLYETLEAEQTEIK